jgi:hypothetical protein
MRLPKVGGIVYAAQSKQARVGATMFMCHTQENASKNLGKLKKEALDNLCYPELEDYDKKTGKWVPVHEPENAKDLVIWEMRRIQ